MPFITIEDENYPDIEPIESMETRVSYPWDSSYYQDDYDLSEEEEEEYNTDRDADREDMLQEYPGHFEIG